MGEIADSLISGEFDYITGEYLGEAVGYPRTHVYGRREYIRLLKRNQQVRQMYVFLICAKTEALITVKRLSW